MGLRIRRKRYIIWKDIHVLQAALTGLFLNLIKCAAMAYEQNQTQGAHGGRLKFKNGQNVKTTDKELYVGGQVRTGYNTIYEVGRRIALGEAAYRDMKGILLDRKK